MKSLIIVLLLFSSATTFARDKDREFRDRLPNRKGNEGSERVTSVRVGLPAYSGNGCPDGTMRVTFAPDYLSFSVLFDQFIAEVSDESKNRASMNCTASVPMEAPEGMQMEITRVDFRGFAALPNRAHAALNSTFNFRGGKGDGDRMNIRYRFTGPVMEDYEISSQVLNENGSVQETELSPCGGRFQLRLVNRLSVVSPAKGEVATVTIDSIDGSGQAIYFVNWRECRKN